MATWRQLVADASDRLGSAVEARWLAEEAAGGALPAWIDEVPTRRVAGWFCERVTRRAGGEPLQYVIGRWPFRAIDLMVDRRVLIPRPETEVVVDVALSELDALDRVRQRRRSPLAVDLGTGSGAIAISLAVEREGIHVWATDASQPALDVAGANLAGVGGRVAPRVRLAHGSWWNALPGDLMGEVDLAVANPPYVTTAEMEDLDPVVADWEPREALEAGPDGLEDVATILELAPEWLAPHGRIVVEIAPHQSERAAALVVRSGFADVEIRKDLAGKDRMVVGRLGLRPSS